MARTYNEISESRRSRLSSEARAQQEVFEKAYDIALQVIGSPGEARAHPGATR